MKLFHYNALVKQEDFADREQDIKALLAALKKGRKVVLYAPRRYGKTSLAHNILPEKFVTKDAAHLYVDLMDCSSLESITLRLLEAYMVTLRTYFKKANIIQTTKRFLKNLTLGVSSDPMTGEVAFEIVSGRGHTPSLFDVLESITTLCRDKKTLLVFDEFQDLAEIPEALALFRSHLQKLPDTPVLFLGSKRKLLAKIFSSQQSPFFNFAQDHVLGPIPLEDWISFFEERLRPRGIKIEKIALKRLCQEVLQVPNAICEVGAFIQDYHEKCGINENRLLKILSDLIDKKSETYRYQLTLLSPNELKVCKALAYNQFTKNINGNEFLTLVQMGASSISKVIQKLYRAGIIEEEPMGYRLSNPVLGLFLKYRQY